MEKEIKKMLVMQGYDQHEIRFRGEKDRYIMYGYWDHINPNDLNSISEKINVNFKIVEWEDSDCGWLFSYHIIERNKDELE